MDWETGGIELVTYCLILTTDVFADFRYTLKKIGDDCVCVQIELGLERDKSVATKQRHGKRTLKT